MSDRSERIQQFFAAFQDEAKALVHHKILNMDECGSIASAFARIAADMEATAQRAEVVPPMEPTPEMLKARTPLQFGIAGPYGDERYYLRDEELRAIWQAMYTASPSMNEERNK